MKRPLKFPLKYEKGIRLITRKGTAKEAEKAFRDLYIFEIRNLQIRKWGKANEERVQEIVKENIEHLRTVGFDEVFYFRCQDDYAQMPRRAPRKKMRKSLDAFGIPKLTKKPLDTQVSATLAGIKLVKKQEKVRK
jgi:hypothetical protein